MQAPTTDGGEGRLTAAVTRTDVQPLLRADRAQVVVESRGTRREYEVVSTLRRADRRFRRFTVGAGSRLAGATLGSVLREGADDVTVFAVHTSEGWQVAPPWTTVLTAGDELFAVGRRPALEGFAEVVA